MPKDMIKVTGLWKNKTRDGSKYLSGSLGSLRIMIFQNSYKETDKHPDYVMYVAENKKQEETAPAPGPATETVHDDLNDLPF